MGREIHIHVEEPSMEAYLLELLPRLDVDCASVKIINHTNKQKLLREIPARIRGYSRIPQEFRPLTLVLVDRDDDDCRALKQTLEDAANQAGLITKSTAADESFEVVNRIVIEELEAWHFGDISSLADEYPGVPLSLGNKAPYRDPDAILGGTHEALLRVLQSAGHYPNLPTLPKVETARRLAKRNDFLNNRSGSFQQFRLGLTALAYQAIENQNHA